MHEDQIEALKTVIAAAELRAEDLEMNNHAEDHETAQKIYAGIEMLRTFFADELFAEQSNG